MYYLSKEELLKACENNRFIVLRSEFSLIAINCKVAFLKYPKESYARNIDGATIYIGFYPCDFNTYITYKAAFFKTKRYTHRRAALIS